MVTRQDSRDFDATKTSAHDSPRLLLLTRFARPHRMHSQPSATPRCAVPRIRLTDRTGTRTGCGAAWPSAGTHLRSMSFRRSGCSVVGTAKAAQGQSADVVARCTLHTPVIGIPQSLQDPSDLEVFWCAGGSSFTGVWSAACNPPKPVPPTLSASILFRGATDRR